MVRNGGGARSQERRAEGGSSFRKDGEASTARVCRSKVMSNKGEVLRLGDKNGDLGGGRVSKSRKLAQEVILLVDHYVNFK